MERTYKAKNGVSVYSYPNPALHSFYISLVVKAGSMYETEKTQGITHFLEHIAIRNVHALCDGRLYAMLDRYGLDFNAATYNEMVRFYISGADLHFEHAAKVIALLLSPIVLKKSEIDLERRRIKAEIREGDEKNSLANFSSAILYPDTTLRFPIVGTNKSVDAVNGARIEAYRRAIFTPQNLFFYVTGNVTEENIRTLLSAIEAAPLADGEPRQTCPTPPAAFGMRDAAVHVKQADFTMMRFHFDMDMTRVSEPEADLLYDLLLSGYSSRFFIEMSENRGLFYDITGSLETYRNIGCFYFSFELKAADVPEATRLAVEILRDVKTRLLDPAQIPRAPYVDNAGLLYDNPGELNFTFSYDRHILNLPYRSLEDRRAAYAAVTPQRLREVAREVFRAKNCVLTLKGDRKKIDTELLHNILLKLDI